MITITEDEIRSRLAIDKSRLDDEIELHSQVLEHISRKVDRLSHEVALAADDLKRIEAGLLLDFRREENKGTAAENEARVIRDSSRREALKIQLAYVEQLGTWKGLQEAWRNKGYGMRALTDLYASSYFDTFSSTRSRRDREDGNTDYRLALGSRRTQAAQVDEPQGGLRRRRMTE